MEFNQRTICLYSTSSCYLQYLPWLRYFILYNKAELEAPFPESPNEGRLEFFVDCSANATPEFEGRGGDELATEISRTLTRAYRDPQVFDLKSLCLLPGRQVSHTYR